MMPMNGAETGGFRVFFKVSVLPDFVSEHLTRVLNSLSGFSTSVARNLDRLSFDKNRETQRSTSTSSKHTDFFFLVVVIVVVVVVGQHLKYKHIKCFVCGESHLWVRPFGCEHRSCHESTFGWYEERYYGCIRRRCDRSNWCCDKTPRCSVRCRISDLSKLAACHRI